MQHVMEAQTVTINLKRVSKLTNDDCINTMTLNVYTLYAAGKGGTR